MNLGEAIKEINQLNKSIREKLESIKKFEKQYGKIILSGMLEEKKTLSDKEVIFKAEVNGDHIEISFGGEEGSHIYKKYVGSHLYKQKDVKEALKELQKQVHLSLHDYGTIKEIFGKDLI